MPDLSIIIPCYNCLKEATQPCIESIQSTEAFELIIIDNGSSDGTEQYFRKLALEKNVPFEYIDGDTINLTQEEKQKSENE